MAESKESAVNSGDGDNLLHKLLDIDGKMSALEISEALNGCFGRPGSQLEDRIEFKSRDGKSIWAYPVLVDFRRLLQLGQLPEGSGIIPGVIDFSSSSSINQSCLCTVIKEVARNGVKSVSVLNIITSSNLTSSRRAEKAM